MSHRFATFNKALVAAGAACTVTASALADGAVSTSEVFTIAAAWIGVAGVWGVTNSPRLSADDALVAPTQNGSLPGEPSVSQEPELFELTDADEAVTE